MLKLDSKFSVFSYYALSFSMEHEDDDVLILCDETDGPLDPPVKIEPVQIDNEELFRQIDEAIADQEPSVTSVASESKSRDVPLTRYVTHVTASDHPAADHSGMKKVRTPVQVPSITSVMSNVASMLSVSTARRIIEIDPEPIASTSRLNNNLLSRLGPKVTPQVPLFARLGPPNDSVALDQGTFEEGGVEVVEMDEDGAEPKAKRPRGPDRRPEKYKTLTQQGLVVLDLPELERAPVQRPFQAAEQYNRNDILWRELTHKDRTAREHSEWNLYLQTPHYMPVISYQTARNMINVTYKVVQNHRLEVLEFKEGQVVRDSDPIIIEFEKEIRECGYMAFDTEGGGDLPSKIHQTKKNNRVFIAMSSPKTGRVLLFHCMNNVPQILLKLLADYAVAKLQSNIAADVKILDDIGYDVRGLVDTGVLYTFLNPGTVADGFGAKKQNEEIWPGSTHYVPYEYWTFNKAYQTQTLTERARRHVVQDVILPYAILLEAACRRVKTDAKSETDIFPWVNELLELAYTREPIFIRARTPKESARMYWLPPVQGNEFDLNSKSDCTLVRRARASYIENFEGPTLQERKRSAEAIWKYRELPSTRHKVFRVSNWSLIMVQNCNNCGDQKHETKKCQQPMVPCVVPHYPGVNWPDHSILCCPQLHSRCTICRMRGHINQQHPSLDLTPREFREDFWKYCHLGLFTSLPFLYETNGPLRAHHWRANMMLNRMPRGLGDLWLYRGPTYRFPQEYVDQVADKRQIVDENVRSTIWTYRCLMGNADE